MVMDHYSLAPTHSRVYEKYLLKGPTLTRFHLYILGMRLMAFAIRCFPALHEKKSLLRRFLFAFCTLSSRVEFNAFLYRAREVGNRVCNFSHHFSN